MSTTFDIDSQTIPGRWIDFSPVPPDVAERIPGPYKVIMKKMNELDSDVGMCYLMSIQTNLIEYRPRLGRLGPHTLPNGTLIKVLDESESAVIEQSENVRSCALKYLKALVGLRTLCLGYNPYTGAVTNSAQLREMLFFRSSAPSATS